MAAFCPWKGDGFTVISLSSGGSNKTTFPWDGGMMQCPPEGRGLGFKCERDVTDHILYQNTFNNA